MSVSTRLFPCYVRVTVVSATLSRCAFKRELCFLSSVLAVIVMDFDFASKDETDVYLYLVDHGFDEKVASVFQGRRQFVTNQS